MPSCVLCLVLCALCPVPCNCCSVLRAPCSVLNIQCSSYCALCSSVVCCVLHCGDHFSTYLQRHHQKDLLIASIVCFSKTGHDTEMFCVINAKIGKTFFGVFFLVFSVFGLFWSFLVEFLGVFGGFSSFFILFRRKWRLKLGAKDLRFGGWEKEDLCNDLERLGSQFVALFCLVAQLSRS
jgi:hypothetical protein